jgi:hypothetical protein
MEEELDCGFAYNQRKIMRESVYTEIGSKLFKISEFEV